MSSKPKPLVVSFVCEACIRGRVIAKQKQETVKLSYGWQHAAWQEGRLSADSLELPSLIHVVSVKDPDGVEVQWQMCSCQQAAFSTAGDYRRASIADAFSAALGFRARDCQAYDFSTNVLHWRHANEYRDSIEMRWFHRSAKQHAALAGFRTVYETRSLAWSHMTSVAKWSPFTLPLALQHAMACKKIMPQACPPRKRLLLAEAVLALQPSRWAAALRVLPKQDRKAVLRIIQHREAQFALRSFVHGFSGSSIFFQRDRVAALPKPVRRFVRHKIAAALKQQEPPSLRDWAEGYASGSTWRHPGWYWEARRFYDPQDADAAREVAAHRLGYFIQAAMDGPSDWSPFTWVALRDEIQAAWTPEKCEVAEQSLSVALRGARFHLEHLQAGSSAVKEAQRLHALLREHDHGGVYDKAVELAAAAIAKDNHDESIGRGQGGVKAHWLFLRAFSSSPETQEQADRQLKTLEHIEAVGSTPL